MRRLRLNMVKMLLLTTIQITLLGPPVFHPETKIKIQETLIVLILCGYKPWSVILRKKTLRVFEDRVLRNICGQEGGFMIFLFLSGIIRKIK